MQLCVACRRIRCLRVKLMSCKSLNSKDIATMLHTLCLPVLRIAKCTVKLHAVTAWTYAQRTAPCSEGQCSLRALPKTLVGNMAVCVCPGRCPLGAWAMQRTPSSAAMSTSEKLLGSGRTLTFR